jgi:hypothetical protein
MTREPMTCPKCSGRMESGFMVDRAGIGSDLQGRWVEGDPIPRFFFDGVKMQGREPLPVRTYRCEGCGYLESFAMPTA